MKHPCSFRVMSKGWSSTACFPLHLVRRERTQQDHTVTMPRWPAPGITTIEHHQYSQTQQCRAGYALLAAPARCPVLRAGATSQGCCCIPAGWPADPCPERHVLLECRDAGAGRPPLLSLRFINRGSACCGSLGCITTYLLYCQSAAQAVCGKNIPTHHRKNKPHTFCSATVLMDSAGLHPESVSATLNQKIGIYPCGQLRLNWYAASKEFQLSFQKHEAERPQMLTICPQEWQTI